MGQCRRTAQAAQETDFFLRFLTNKDMPQERFASAAVQTFLGMLAAGAMLPTVQHLAWLSRPQLEVWVTQGAAVLLPP